MTSSCLDVARSSVRAGHDPAAVLRDLYDALLALGDDDTAEGVAELVLAVEAQAATAAAVLVVLDTLHA